MVRSKVGARVALDQAICSGNFSNDNHLGLIPWGRSHLYHGWVMLDSWKGDTAVMAIEEWKNGGARSGAHLLTWRVPAHPHLVRRLGCACVIRRFRHCEVGYLRQVREDVPQEDLD